MMRFASAICLCLALLAHAHAARAGSPAQTASKEQWRAAQKLFDAADELYDAGKYAEALTAYRASYDIVASPNSRLMVARSFLALGRLSHALRELERAEREANEVASHDVQYRRTAQAARAEIDALLTKNGRLTLVLEGAMADAAVSINGREMPKAELGDVLVFAPGRLVIVARMPSGTSTRRDVDLAAGTQQSIDFADTGAARPRAYDGAAGQSTPRGSTVSVLTWTSAGVGVAGVLTFAIFGTLNNSKFAELESKCPQERCPSDQREDVATGKRYQLIANVGLGVGAGALGAAATVWLLGRKSRSSPSHAALPELMVSERSAQLGWQGRF